MTLERECVSLDLAKRLKELGCPQNSLFYWVQYPNEEWYLKCYCFTSDKNNGCVWDKISAYTTGELGEMLPYGFMSGLKSRGYECSYHIGQPRNNPMGLHDGMHYELADTEADVRGLMLIHLYENKIIEVSK